MSLSHRIRHLVEDFVKLGSWEERYKYLIEQGKTLAPLRPDQKIEANKVKGCTSQVWLAVEWREEKIYFFADSDAAIVRGIVAILLRVYSGATPEEILETKPQFIEEMGLNQHLSINRVNGLGSMIKQISFYALAFKAKRESSL